MIAATSEVRIFMLRELEEDLLSKNEGAILFDDSYLQNPLSKPGAYFLEMEIPAVFPRKLYAYCPITMEKWISNKEPNKIDSWRLVRNDRKIQRSVLSKHFPDLLQSTLLYSSPLFNIYGVDLQWKMHRDNIVKIVFFG